MTTHTKALYDAWRNAIASNKIVNNFQALHPDAEDRWSKGDAICFGLKNSDHGLTYYAENITQSKSIIASDCEKTDHATGFICQLNGYRALRPGGAHCSPGRQADISPDINHCRFYCQDIETPLSLLSREKLVQVELSNFVWNAYYNALPIEKQGHFLWIPVSHDPSAPAIPHLPQLMTREILEDAIALFQNLAGTILFFNSLHAGASVNHIHFQAVYHKDTLPIEVAETSHFKGYKILNDYPAQGIVFKIDDEAEFIFKSIAELQNSGIPFNLIMLGKRIVVIPRNIDHEIVEEFPGGMLASMEMSGKLITVDALAYEQINADRIYQALTKATLAPQPIINSWN